MANPNFSNVGACAFDAYGTLFDVTGAAAHSRDRLGDKADRLAEIWRRKQLQYTWLRSLMGRYADFWQVTGEALDHAMAAVGVNDPGLRAQLMQLYLSLPAYPDVTPTLERLKSRGVKCAILSNGTRSMLFSAVKHAGIYDLLDAIVSVEQAGVFKPHPSVYQLAVDELKLAPAHICFVSANAWDAHAASAFGFRVAWINRSGEPKETIPADPHAEIRTLAELPPLLLGD
jgi:2-haloacid dehalogenase